MLWAHLLDDDLSTPDERATHEGMPVLGGLKLGVNLHAHRSNVRTRVLAGCPPATPPVPHTFHYESQAGSSPLLDAMGWHALAAIPAIVAAGDTAEHTSLLC